MYEMMMMQPIFHVGYEDGVMWKQGETKGLTTEMTWLRKIAAISGLEKMEETTT